MQRLADPFFASPLLSRAAFVLACVIVAVCLSGWVELAKFALSGCILVVERA